MICVSDKIIDEYKFYQILLRGNSSFKTLVNNGPDMIKIAAQNFHFYLDHRDEIVSILNNYHI